MVIATRAMLLRYATVPYPSIEQSKYSNVQSILQNMVKKIRGYNSIITVKHT